MSKIIKLKIDVLKFDKTAFYKGAKGTYADITFFLNDEPDQYGNHGTLYQDISKERRDKGEKGAILGNGKVFRDTSPVQAHQKPARPQPSVIAPSNLHEDEIPF